MNFRETLREAILLLRAHPLRSSLTLFGLVWGTAAVIFLSSWGAGLRTMNEKAFQRAGKNMLLMWAGRVSEDFSPAKDRRYLWLTWDDVKALRARARQPELIAAETRQFVSASFGPRARSFQARGVEPDGVAIRGAPLAAGRFVSQSDVDHRRRVMVIGHRARQQLLGPSGGVGSVVRLDGLPFRVIGVLGRVGTQLARDGPELDEQIWVPLSTHLLLWPNTWGISDDVVSQVVVRLRDRKLLDSTEAEVRRILAARLGVPPGDKEALPSFSPVAMLRNLPLDTQNAVNFLIAATTILIAAFGVLSLMLDSVRERRSEIGIRLAVGARKREILLQFALETLVIMAIGGGLGIVLGVAGAKLLASETLRAGIPPALNDLIPVPELGVRMMVVAVGILMFTGLLAALVPARRASRVDPAITLRAD